MYNIAIAITKHDARTLEKTNKAIEANNQELAAQVQALASREKAASAALADLRLKSGITPDCTEKQIATGPL